MLKRILTSAVVLTTSLITSVNVQAELNPAFINDTYTARFLWQAENQSLENNTFSCPELVAPKHVFETVSIYKDTDCRCEVDPVKKAAYDAENAYIKDYISTIVGLADTYVATPSERGEIAQCMMQHVEHWAANDAMLGDHVQNVGYHKTAELIGTIATSYLKVRNSPDIVKIDANSVVGSWLKRASDHVLYFYDNIAGSTTKKNNHRYWDGYHLGRVAIAIQDESLFSWAVEGLSIGLDEVDANGVLPEEFARGDRAFSYHLYATLPLVGLAELAIANREYMPVEFYPYEYNNGALHTLLKLMRDVSNGNVVGVFPEEREMKCHEAAWLEAYLERAKVADKAAIKADVINFRNNCNGKLFNTFLGGNVSLTYGSPM
ncbi:alginate lyase family protein [Aestuariibacter sp. AA17]|uniref:Alginate lyase family protein n=1 Tax=Fluctibacter corallii TaxID=2984329 RepID=A0ABT3A899_9ALTE|nr:alginate lyase family protein [Aestuariibacter sp. AA17]MCV2884901.1 alginate lyase family protein [Aestuariibacter sp. AA17]